jgi:hypothetical protein
MSFEAVAGMAGDAVALIQEVRRLRGALEEIRQLVHPKGTEPRLEGCAGCYAERALGSNEVPE